MHFEPFCWRRFIGRFFLVCSRSVNWIFFRWNSVTQPIKTRCRNQPITACRVMTWTVKNNMHSPDVFLLVLLVSKLDEKHKYCAGF